MAWTDGNWSQNDSKFWGYPFITDAGIADEFDGNNSIWKMEKGNFFDYPFIRMAGIADPYQENVGNSQLYLGADNVKKLYVGSQAVKRVYRGRTLIFESE